VSDFLPAFPNIFTTNLELPWPKNLTDGSPKTRRIPFPLSMLFPRHTGSDRRPLRSALARCSARRQTSVAICQRLRNISYFDINCTFPRKHYDKIR
jgi:hypothetical protein